MKTKQTPAKSKQIPAEVKQQAEEIIERFNNTTLAGTDSYYSVRFKGQYLYLDRTTESRFLFRKITRSGPICRLKYNGEMNNWNFAIYKYSKDAYDPEEWLFPGDQHVDGTIEGAMKAGLEAYP